MSRHDYNEEWGGPQITIIISTIIIVINCTIGYYRWALWSIRISIIIIT